MSRSKINCDSCFKPKCQGDCKDAMETSIMRDINKSLKKWGYHIVITDGDSMRDYLFKIIKLNK